MRIINARLGSAGHRAFIGSVLATHLLLAKQPTSLVAFGAGRQIEAHTHLHIRMFPSLKKCTIINRSQNTRLENLLSTLRHSHPSVMIDSSTLGDRENVKNAVEHADIICTAVPATAPLISSEWVSPGTHFNVVGGYKGGMTEVIGRAGTVVVDSAEACSREGVHADQMIEIGTLVEDNDCGGTIIPASALCDQVRMSGDITMFTSVGIGLQDVAIAHLVVSRAEEMKIGTVVESYHD